MMDATLSDQVSAIVAENQHLRVRSENADRTIHLLKEQYDAVASSVEGIRAKHDREIHAMRTERDVAVRRFKEIDTLLMQLSDILMQALRARQGDGTPMQMPDRPSSHIMDDRLPIARLG